MRENGTTYMVVPLRCEPDMDEAARIGDMLTPEETAYIAAAYGGEWMAGAAEAIATGCHLCIVPASLRDPRIPWPECEHSTMCG